MRNFLLIMGMLIAIPGCSESGPKTFQATGSVTFDGKPVPAGEISFEPRADRNNAGQQTFVEFRDGTFDTRDANRGHIGGPHRLRVSGFDGVKIVNEEEGTENLNGKPLFLEYVIELELEHADTAINIEVPESAGMN